MVLEGKKGEKARQWGDNSHDTYVKIDAEAQRRTLDFIERNAQAGKPFYVANWPNLTSFLPSPQKVSAARSLLQDGLQGNVDPFVGRVMAKLRELGIAENTLVVCMADNGPMAHNPPPGCGFAETIFRGGKGDFLEGGVRVPAFAWWPGTIKPGQIVNDIIHETDLFTTFARLGGALDNVPTDRVIDGIDQTALFMNGDEHGRRDWVFIYTGDELGATVKGRYKRHWISSGEGADTGTAAVFFDLITDPRESSPKLVPLIWQSGQWDRMLKRHLIWMEKYPNRPKARGIPFTEIDNARPETKAIGDRLAEMRGRVPFDPLEFVDFELPDKYKVSMKVEGVD